MNTIPIFFVLFIVFIIYVQVKMKQGAKTPQWNQSFWSKEKASNFARKKDISESEKLADAESIFSYALDIGSDISSTYITLGKIYAQTDRIEQIQPLIERVKKQDFFMRDTVIDKLTGIVRSYQ